MKKYYFMAIAAIGMMAACNKVEVGNTTPTTPEIDDTTPVAVQFGVATQVLGIETRSTGTVGSTEDAENVWNNQTLYVFGYDRTVTDFNTGTAFIDNISAVANPNNAVQEGEEPGTANKAKVVLDVLNPDPDPESDTDSPEPFYYGTARAYDFYGYHIDDAYKIAGTETAPVPSKEATRVYVPFEINGGQDLMIAKADPATDIASNDKFPVGEDSKKDVSRVYSAYAARRDAQPTLTFKHQLARFTFEIIAGSESGNNVSVTAIKLESQYKGNLEIIGENRGLTDLVDLPANNLADLKNPVEPKTIFTLKERKEGATELTDLDTADGKTKPNAWVAARNTPKSIGESIMVIPGKATYNMIVETQMDGVTVQPEPLNMVLDATKLLQTDSSESAGATIFEAGKSYRIKIIIYGLEKVEITAELEKWVPGGDITIDPDEE